MHTHTHAHMHTHRHTRTHTHARTHARTRTHTPSRARAGTGALADLVIGSVGHAVVAAGGFCRVSANFCTPSHLLGRMLGYHLALRQEQRTVGGGCRLD